MTSDAAAIHRAAAILRRGGIVAFPTETVYGLGADAFNPLAVARVFEAKRRPFFDPLIVHVAGTEEMEGLVTDIPTEARKLIDRFWPGPLTVVLPKREEVPDIVTAGLPSVAIRMPRHEMALSLIKETGSPVAAPSANPFGYVSPTTAEHVREQLGDLVDLILDGGPCEVGVESTILSFLEGKIRLLRPGGAALEEIEAVAGKVETGIAGEMVLSAPGMLPRHYAPQTPVVFRKGEAFPEAWKKKRIAYLAFREPTGPLAEAARVEVLSKTGDLREAAANLFSALRRLDAAGADLIVAELVPERGLGRAIMDRLRRASTHRDVEVRGS